MPPESELLAARLARMKFLVDALEVECGAGRDIQENFLKLKREIEQARAALRDSAQRESRV
jgi:hypothetical protein